MIKIDRTAVYGAAPLLLLRRHLESLPDSPKPSPEIVSYSAPSIMLYPAIFAAVAVLFLWIYKTVIYRK